MQLSTVRLNSFEMVRSVELILGTRSRARSTRRVVIVLGKKIRRAAQRRKSRECATAFIRHANGYTGFRLTERRTVSALEQVFVFHPKVVSGSGRCRDFVVRDSAVERDK